MLRFKDIYMTSGTQSEILTGLLLNHMVTGFVQRIFGGKANNNIKVKRTHKKTAFFFFFFILVVLEAIFIEVFTFLNFHNCSIFSKV